MRSPNCIDVAELIQLAEVYEDIKHNEETQEVQYRAACLAVQLRTPLEKLQKFYSSVLLGVLESKRPHQEMLSYSKGACQLENTVDK